MLRDGDPVLKIFAKRGILVIGHYSHILMLMNGPRIYKDR
jgi:hypothetical protein